MPSGDCFHRAIELIAEGRYEDPILVHGLPRYVGEPHDGELYWHAWVEHKGPYETWWVADYSADKELDAPRDWYYQLGRIEITHRYTPEAMMEMIAEHESSGPWVEGWETMGL